MAAFFTAFAIVFVPSFAALAPSMRAPNDMKLFPRASRASGKRRAVRESRPATARERCDFGRRARRRRLGA
ncbi:MAG: hypothetical protein KGI57_09845, partial [Hyphomicrobiales bacterium]|nr:hypothetical protein [Hyphomicrobiales bacterium]